MVWRALEAGSPGGGYILGTAHNVPPETPTENVVALYEAAETWGG
jgi:uroporphyrinogen-III decarboxylase